MGGRTKKRRHSPPTCAANCRATDGNHGSRERTASNNATGFPPESPGTCGMGANVPVASPSASVCDLLLPHSGSAGQSRSEVRGGIVAASGKGSLQQRCILIEQIRIEMKWPLTAFLRYLHLPIDVHIHRTAI